MTSILESLGLKAAGSALNRAMDPRLWRRIGRWIFRRDMPPMDGDRFNVLVADLLHDDERTETRHILHALERFDGLRVSGVGGVQGLKDLGDRTKAVAAAEAAGRKLLAEKKGDVLIWGELAVSGDRRVLRLRFLSQGVGGPAKSYTLNDNLELPASFDKDVANLVAAQVFAAIEPDSDTHETYAANRLRSVMERVGALVEKDAPGLMPNAMAELRLSAANAAITLGEQAGDHQALENAVRWCSLVENARGISDQEVTALAKGIRANALSRLGQREVDTVRLEEAVTAYNGALRFFTRTDQPYRWATTQNNLGATLSELGGREEGTALLQAAIIAYRNALEVRNRTDLPIEWATTKNNLGNALGRLGEREEGTAHLEEAITAYRSVLKVYSRATLPLDWAMAQNNLGNALGILGGRQESTLNLEDAVTAYRRALEVYTLTDLPLQWAMTQNNLGNVLRTLGERAEDTMRVEEAITAFHRSLEVRTRTELPLLWATTQDNLGNALKTLGALEEGAARLEEACTAYRNALDVFPDASPHRVAKTQRNLEQVKGMIAARQ